ncbi:protein-glutamate O-methyltransferase CheR [Shewanella sp. JM162201]|uniref:Chemotaxis protein methyltransferase n=1 Tax=Shewanella jiangmenensis TaxID=2837387 RepID=A0ABS5V5T4_9GAMM|nr:protein-glutamate O-methyltransferase CheR [Shewanella jiangmenensis]MBT1445187.1 protein-glutamate O-methyltransferase CheR [Shewanella jiangmenensis]
MTQADFEFIRDLAYSQTGIVLPDRKRHMVYSRLCRRLRALRINDFRQYCLLLQQQQEQELGHFINALTTNLTSFFREKHHFEFLRDELIPRWQKRADKRLRIWSSACSTGEEPYSIAMTLEPFFAKSPWDLKILATDLDTNVLTKAEAGLYPPENLENLPGKLMDKYFQPKGNVFKVTDDAQKLVFFRQLNLLESWPMQGPFDVIFCRNVLIYFDNPTKKKIISKFRQLLSDDGYLFIGHSETLHHISDEFDLIGQTIYRPNRRLNHF